jgi:hypothetical protein
VTINNSAGPLQVWQLHDGLAPSRCWSSLPNGLNERAGSPEANVIIRVILR